MTDGPENKRKEVMFSVLQLICVVVLDDDSHL